MIGPAEIEDMRLDLVASQERAMLYDIALAPLHRHWVRRVGPSEGAVTRICDLVFAKADERTVADWKVVVSEAVEEAGYGLLWEGDEVIALEARPRPI